MSGSGPDRFGLFTDLNSRISLAFLERYPSPADARGLGEARLAAFLARERYSGRQQPAQLLAKLRRAPDGRVGELELATRRQLVLTLVATIKTLNAQIKELERQIAIAIREHPDGAIFLSLFKGADSVITAAELLAEIGDCRARYPVARRARRRRRPVRRRDRVRQTQDRMLSLGLQQAPALTRSARWPTAPATGTPGRRTSTPPLAPAVTTTPARYAPSDVRGAESCGSAGKTACRMTPPATAHCNAISPSPFPPRRAPGPTSLPPSGWPAPLSPEGRPAGPSAQRL